MNLYQESFTCLVSCFFDKDEIVLHNISLTGRVPWIQLQRFFSLFNYRHPFIRALLEKFAYQENGALFPLLWLFIWILSEYFNNHINAPHCNTVTPDQTVTCIKRSYFSWPVIEHFIWIEPFIRGHLSYKVTFSLSQRWPLNTGLTVL